MLSQLHQAFTENIYTGNRLRVKFKHSFGHFFKLRKSILSNEENCGLNSSNNLKYVTAVHSQDLKISSFTACGLFKAT